MADQITTSKTLKVETAFVDGDTRTINIKNPNTNDEQLSAKIGELNTFIRANAILVGDRDGATFAQINKATVVTKQTSNLDLTT